MAPDQLDVVVEHVKGGFHLNHGRQKARNLNVTEIVEDPEKEIQILTATLPFMSACFDFSSTFKCAICEHSDSDRERRGQERPTVWCI